MLWILVHVSTEILYTCNLNSEIYKHTCTCKWEFFCILYKNSKLVSKNSQQWFDTYKETTVNNDHENSKFIYFCRFRSHGPGTMLSYRHHFYISCHLYCHHPHLCTVTYSFPKHIAELKKKTLQKCSCKYSSSEFIIWCQCEIKFNMATRAHVKLNSIWLLEPMWNSIQYGCYSQCCNLIGWASKLFYSLTTTQSFEIEYDENNS
jgi:hypothetical protein